LGAVVLSVPLLALALFAGRRVRDDLRGAPAPTGT
jgi:hypothetical protein